MRTVIEKSMCTGCTACVGRCPSEAISMNRDSEGFIYPEIDEALCTECGVCRKVCPAVSNLIVPYKFTVPMVYAAKHNSDAVRMKSSSGGMFTALSDAIFEEGGVVYGAAFSEAFTTVAHLRATGPQQRDACRGSKYVQSYLDGTFQSVRNDLEMKKKVLFSGTPCQNAGLRSYLKGTDTTTLYCCDLVCHGVASPMVWELYLAYLKKKYRQPIAEFSFRYKTESVAGTRFRALLKNGKKVSEDDLDIFAKIYFGHYATRPSCHNCLYATTDRVSDITIADYWGIENVKIGFSDDKGISLVLANTRSGMELFAKIQPAITAESSTIEECLQPNLARPSTQSVIRKMFITDLESTAFKDVLQKYKIKDTILVRMKKLARKLF